MSSEIGQFWRLKCKQVYQLSPRLLRKSKSKYSSFNSWTSLCEPSCVSRICWSVPFSHFPSSLASYNGPTRKLKYSAAIKLSNSKVMRMRSMICYWVRRPAWKSISWMAFGTSFYRDWLICRVYLKFHGSSLKTKTQLPVSQNQCQFESHFFLFSASSFC